MKQEPTAGVLSKIAHIVGNTTMAPARRHNWPKLRRDMKRRYLKRVRAKTARRHNRGVKGRTACHGRG